MSIKESRRQPTVVVARRGVTRETFTARMSSNGAFHVMDAGAFSKASRKASQALAAEERKQK